MKIEMRRCASCGLNRRLARYVGKKGTVCDWCRRAQRRAHARKRHLRTAYELSVEEYDALLAFQDGHCAGCKNSRPYNLAVDHDHAIEHKRESLRGLLCKRCNGVLADVRDDIGLLEALIAYLRNPPAREVLGSG